MPKRRKRRLGLILSNPDPTVAPRRQRFRGLTPWTALGLLGTWSNRGALAWSWLAVWAGLLALALYRSRAMPLFAILAGPVRSNTIREPPGMTSP